MTEPLLPQKAPCRQILLVDDEEMVARVLKMLFIHLGYVVETAETAEEALRLFEPGKYDLVTTDYQLAGMNGVALARALKAVSPEQRIILISAFADSKPWGTEGVPDFAAVLGKPFSVDDLKAAVAKVFGPSG